MTYIIQVKGVNDAVDWGLQYLLEKGKKETSRNGKVLVAPGPVITEYAHPTQRVLFSKTRDANPFFHLMEALWMMAGRRDLKWPAYFNARFSEYSDDGKTIFGAYGYRWHNWFLIDQISRVVAELVKKPDTRRAVIGMWDPSKDLPQVALGGKDVPCNTHIYFDARGGMLNMTVCCRSNDAIWGAYGANAVHFSILHEFIAHEADLAIGTYRQFSNNFHAYLDIYNAEALEKISVEGHDQNYYRIEGPAQVKPYAIISTSSEVWMKDLNNFLGAPDVPATFEDPFFNEVAWPMYQAWVERKMNRGSGITYATAIRAADWRIACVEWINRREEKKNATRAT